MEELLLVDCGACDAALLRTHLSHAGYKIAAIVTSADQAVESAKNINPDCIMPDFHIRNKSTGLHLYEDIR